MSIVGNGSARACSTGTPPAVADAMDRLHAAPARRAQAERLLGLLRAG